MKIITKRLIMEDGLDLINDKLDIKLKNTGEVIGYIIPRSTLGARYCIYENHRKNGYATEALIAVKEYLLQTGKNCFLVIGNRNIASQTVAKKAGFLREINNNVVKKFGSYKLRLDPDCLK